LAGSTINVLCLCYLGVYLGVADLSGSGEPSAAAWVAIVAICFFAVRYGFGWAPVFSLTVLEICPTPVRGIVVAIAFVYQKLLNFALTRGFPNMMADMHAYGLFVLAKVLTFVAVPEVNGASASIDLRR
jgi:SP family sugar:H+ symporter-like MFS transporter